ncbi:type 1 glutamine amidotransferase domain-containing protein [Staphylococcus arlettae]|uniref:type 1 glutamine amidotransferase domain-containing protein n=1 Tax=Staphylococcus arlettae TaxID=29378 RepID=UPI000DCB5674|nr:type 1 glutamine amidotransferase domain-containing protein [Staphylococcus arlettae]MBF0737472.1 type 1 glutamine amidotransferase domain-containing protein [Staphylococcus arlettae]RBA01742.1 Molecular chaperone Hsp31 and glyoxalase 3 [Staphylococcus arlettae]RBA05937.1 Molecular chaperone Hsp31 and glyoxalase 3 [Staphylococcus arlettae]RBA07110.1 Molecular chaperone Hsp31 and glyoxalase 3 [Staphylococcus arlettae]TFU47556.1 type 1 glutamine amidotransferase domain-containing protein [Sta
MSKKVLFVLTSRNQYDDGSQTGLWLEEASEPYRILAEANITVDLVSIDGGAVPIDANSTQNGELEQYSDFVDKINDVPSIKTVNVDNYDAIYLPGGHGTVFDFGHNQELATVLTGFKEQNKFISSVCHGPSAFVGAKDKNGNFIVKDVTLTAFTDEEERAMGLENKVPFLTQSELENQGAKFVTKDNFVSHVEQDGLFITGQNPQSSIAIGETLRDALTQ